MTLVLTLAVLAALALGSPTSPDPVPCGPLRTWLVGASVLAVSLLATVISLRTAWRIATDESNLFRWLDDFARWKKIHAFVWTVLAITVLFWIDWPTIIRTNLELGGYVLIDDLLILAPLLFSWALSWAAFYEVEAVLESPRATPDGRFDHMMKRGQYVWEQARFSWTVALMPILWILAILDLVRIWSPEVADGYGVFVICGFALVVLATGFPWLLRIAWGAKPLPNGLLQDRLAELTQRSGVKLARILLWPTGGRIVNAAVTGTFAKSRFVFLSDGLVERLELDEVECVLAHELAHVRGRHVLWRVLWILLPMPLMGTIYGSIAGSSQAEVAATSGFWLLAGLGLTLAYVLFGFSWFCRRLEHAADRAAVQLLAQTQSPSQALKRYIATLRQLDAGASSRPTTCLRLHPSLEQRVAFLQSRVAIA